VVYFGAMLGCYCHVSSTVTRVHSDKTAEASIMQFSLKSSLDEYAWKGWRRNSKEVLPSVRFKLCWRVIRYEFQGVISQKHCKIELMSQLIINGELDMGCGDVIVWGRVATTPLCRYKKQLVDGACFQVIFVSFQDQHWTGMTELGLFFTFILLSVYPHNGVAAQWTQQWRHCNPIYYKNGDLYVYSSLFVISDNLMAENLTIMGGLEQ